MAFKRVLWLLVAAIAVAGAGVAVAQASTRDRSRRRYGHSGFGGWRSGSRTATPIEHVVVIFQENVSFDHYFGTYPNASNTDGQRFHAAGRHPGGRWSPAGDQPFAAAEPPPQRQPGDEQSQRGASPASRQ